MTKLKNKVVEVPRPEVGTEFSCFDKQLVDWCIKQYLKVNPFPITLDRDRVNIHFRNNQEVMAISLIAGREYGTFSLEWFPNSYKVAVSTHTFVTINIRNRGIAKWMMGLKFRLAKEHGLTYLLATVDANNTEENRVLESFMTQWSRLTFIGPTTVLWGANINGNTAYRA